jgi:soluble lytic murein transglycosylase-like protein
MRTMIGSSLVHQLALAGAALVAIVSAAAGVRPVYVGRQPVVQRLVKATWTPVAESAADSAAGEVRARAPWAFLASADSALSSGQFREDRRAFVADLVATGRVGPARAESLGTFAVREAYIKRVPPALVFGVLLAENDTFKSRARSSVGAMGLMQVYGKVWVPTLGKFFGRNLADDETNLRYGVHILSQNVYRSAASVVTAEGAVRKGLLRYNGCVRGTNTPNCHRYPAKVRRAVERYAVAQCGDGGYARCVEEPMRASIAAGDGETRYAAR